ncbi:tetratricopeptide repeat protein [Aestuariibaculum lutulentum]|uniref:histidine kinase n=1 Tax=Aestuariibaculum lutulentum TaxID=2920935 RepID=A0ABS9RLQ8_9FLAO|nr:tetratricopeptide repeat protein [Aestuariibaculum lutulentum]MCH4553481.1 tetratricopeptide repeat protein [Aestuariibaculum lutulentum]
MKCNYFRIVLLLSFAVSFSQSTKLDSLQAAFQNDKISDSLRFESGLDAFMLLFRKDLDSARHYANSLLEFSNQKQNKNWEATTLRFIGNTYAYQGNFQEALRYFIMSHNILEALGDVKALSTTYNNIGSIYYELGDFTKAIDNELKGLKIAEKSNDTSNLARLTNNLGNVFFRQNNNEKALEYYTYSLNLKKKIGDKGALIHAYNNIGLVHNSLRQFDEAFENFQICIELSEELDNKISLSRAYENIGELNNLKGDFKTSLEYLNKGIQIKNEINDSDGLVSIYLTRGNAYMGLNQFEKARLDCQKSLELAKATKMLLVEKEACECLSNAWQNLGNYSKALSYYKQSIVAKDSLFNNEKAQEITRQEMEYQFEREKLADSIAFNKQKAEQELQYAESISKQRNKSNLVVFTTIGLLLIGFIYWRSRRKSIKLKQEREVVTRLKQVDQLKDQFLANTSHELRTPLNGIIGLSESLKDGAAGPMSLKAIENLDMIVNSGKRLSNLVNDILDFSKLKNNDLQLSVHPVDLYAITDLVLKVSESLIKGKSLQLINSVPKDIHLVEADENRIQQILYNLIGNAIKFTEKGTVQVKAHQEENKIKISVSDTGIGIPEDKFESIFKSFEQVDGSVEREYGGTGLGLSVTRQLVELHGGTINVESKVGEGSTFTFTLSLSETDRKDVAIIKRVASNDKVQKIKADREDSKVEVLPSENKDIKILVVDDEPINRRVLENHLTVAGYSVVEAGSGKEALNLMKTESFNLILLDIMMPNLSGYEVCEMIRKDFSASELPIVLLTAKNRVSDLVAGFNVGANDYLTKPFSKNELLSRIRTHVNLNGIHKATSRFVPAEFLKSVGREAITDVVLGDHIEKHVTVLFTDIRDYTSLSESMTPEQNFKFVNAYVGRMGPLIKKNKGFVNQYLGDGIMALFPENAAHALQATIDMQKVIIEYNKRRVSEGFRPISVGMGLHTGELVMGIIGDVYRNDTAIIADTVNTASRMEGVTKYYGAKIIISDSSLAKISNKEDFNFRYLGKVRVKGKYNTMGIYECFDGDKDESIALKRKTMEQFERGMTHFFAKEFPKSSVAFDSVLAMHPTDLVAKYFLTKSAEYTLSGAPEDWDYVNAIPDK